MQRDWRTSRLGLLAVLVLLLTLGALFQDFRFDRSLASERRELAATDQQIGSLEVALADFRGAQLGYLATGQGTDFWIRRAADLSSTIAMGLSDLTARSQSADAQAQYEAAATAFASLVSTDKRARDEIQSDQRFLAADLLFVDSVDTALRLSTALSTARSVEIAVAEARMTRLSQLRFALTSLAMGLVLVAALYFGRPMPRPAVSEAEQLAQMLRELPPPVKSTSSSSIARPAAPPVVTPPAPVVAAPIAAAPVVNLRDAAELCVDLARVIDSRDIPALLGRAAAVLEAKGVVIWMADAGGRTLTPSLTHGYSDRVLRRLDALEIDADNVTSLAFRSMRPQTMAGTAAGSAGAIAVPLMTAAGCTGVLAAEVRDSQPAPEMIAVTKIIAAQFATILGPADLGVAQAAQA